MIEVCKSADLYSWKTSEGTEYRCAKCGLNFLRGDDGKDVLIEEGECPKEKTDERA